MTTTRARGSEALQAFVPRLVAELAAHGVPSWTQVDGSMLSADISGFTALSEKLAGKARHKIDHDRPTTRTAKRVWQDRVMAAVFLHGNPETPIIWEPLLAELDRTDVICPQLPGFGCTTDTATPSTRRLPNLAALRSFSEAPELNRPCEVRPPRPRRRLGSPPRSTSRWRVRSRHRCRVLQQSRAANSPYRVM